MSEKITLKLPKAILDKVIETARKKFPLKEIKYYSDATLEALYEFVKEDNPNRGSQKLERAEAAL